MNSLDEITCIKNKNKGKLYLGSYGSLCFVPRYNIHTVISILTQPKVNKIKEINHYIYEIEDDDKLETLEQMKEALIETCQIISTTLDKGQNVLVHCRAGISRSASVVIFYVSYCLGISIGAAYELVKQDRYFVCPNDGFFQVMKMLKRSSK